jgi:hypothetical protein
MTGSSSRGRRRESCEVDRPTRWHAHRRCRSQVAPTGELRLTICFDRGGWSPELFYDIVQAGFDFITYRKGKTRPEPARAFKQVEHQAEGVVHPYLLADRRCRLKLPKGGGRPKTLSVRQVVRKVGEHQTVIITSRADLSAGTVAFRMFSRWRQENYFRYGRAHFGLDALDSYAVVEDDTERLLPNPERKRRERERDKARERLFKLQAALGRIAIEPATTTEEEDVRLDLDVAQAEVDYLEALIARRALAWLVDRAGRCLWVSGELQTARHFSERAVAIRQQWLGDHLDTAESLDLLGRLWPSARVWPARRARRSPTASTVSAPCWRSRADWPWRGL